MTKLQDFLNSIVSDVTPMARHRKTGDLFGVEIECEGENVGYDGRDNIVLDWAPHADGSLREYRGYPPCEWVFNGPVKYNASVKRVNDLFDYFDKKHTKLHTSNRTSIHIHFNMADKTVYQLANMFILFTILEDIFDSYCGEDRKGNLFCLSSRHAEEQVRWMNEACFKHYSFKFREEWRYCALNLASLNKFGTVEFRGMRGLDNREDVLNWLDIVNEFCDYACYKMNNPVTMIENISVNSPIGLLKEIFSEKNFNLLTQGIGEDAINRSVYDGLRLVQMTCYRIGTEFDQVRLRGRDFWASFKDDVEPDRDVDPDDVKRRAERGRLAPPARARGRGDAAPVVFRELVNRVNIGPADNAEVVEVPAGFFPPVPAPAFVARQGPPIDWQLAVDRDEGANARRIENAAQKRVNEIFAERAHRLANED